jgi:hypothetical protein
MIAMIIFIAYLGARAFPDEVYRLRGTAQTAASRILCELTGKRVFKHDCLACVLHARHALLAHRRLRLCDISYTQIRTRPTAPRQGHA